MEIYLGFFICCIVAVLFGVFLAKRQARVFSTPDQTKQSDGMSGQDAFPIANHFDYGDMRFLHLGTPAVQGSMKISSPYEIHLEYVQRMMAWLLFADLDKLKQMHAMQLGLGAASLTKFCYKNLGMQTTAIELNPNVIETCRLWFNLPENDHRLQVLVGDAAEAVANDAWQGKIDVLQVDLYDQDAELPCLDSEFFYKNCRKMLSDTGCMAVNLFGSKSNIPDSIYKIANAFGPDALWVFKPASANTIVLALRTPTLRDKSSLIAQATAIESRWSLPATKWLDVLSPKSLT